MKPEHLSLLPTLSAPSVHPDGAWAVVSVTRPSFVADDQVGQLWTVALDGSGARRMTRGYCDLAPQVSPDGTLVAFLRRQPGGSAQLALVEATGGEPWVLTDLPLGVDGFSWSHDSRTIAVVARVPQAGRYGTVDGVPAEREDARSLRGLQLRHNGLGAGWFLDRPSQIHLVEVPDPQDEPAVPPVGRWARDHAAEPAPGLAPIRRLTEDGDDWQAPVFTADDSGLVAAVSRAGATHLGAELVCLDVETGEQEELPEEDGQIHDWSEPCIVGQRGEEPGARGQRIFVARSDLGASGLEFVGSHPRIGLLEEGRFVPLSADDDVFHAALTRRGDGVVTVEERRGATRVHEFTVGGDRVLLDADVVVQAVAAVPGSDGVVVTVVSPSSPGEVALVHGGRLTVLSDFGADLRQVARVVEPVRHEVDVAGQPVEGWVLKPAGSGPHPVLLVIHGGPYAHVTGSFFDEFQVYVEAGYAVVACNPRGSSGYGRAFGRAVVGRFGQIDADDVLGFLDGVVATDPELDGARVGVMGGSYGGYLTAWIIAHDHRWAGAIVERG